MKAKATIDWQIKEKMCDSFTKEESQRSNSTSKATIDMNRPLHSNWVGLL
jgi:hypothetical protein